MGRVALLLIALILLPSAMAVGIGTLDNQVPVAKRTTTALTFYLSNTEDRTVTVDLAAEGELAEFITLSQSSVTLQPKQSVSIQANVRFDSKLPKSGSAMVVATERDQERQSQIGVQIKTAAPITFNFNPQKKASRSLLPFRQQPAPPRPATPDIIIGDYLATSPVLRRIALSSGLLLGCIVLLILAFDYQLLRHRKQSRRELQDILQRK